MASNALPAVANMMWLALALGGCCCWNELRGTSLISTSAGVSPVSGVTTGSGRGAIWVRGSVTQSRAGARWMGSCVGVGARGRLGIGGGVIVGSVVMFFGGEFVDGV